MADAWATPLERSAPIGHVPPAEAEAAYYRELEELTPIVIPTLILIGALDDWTPGRSFAKAGGGRDERMQSSNHEPYRLPRRLFHLSQAAPDGSPLFTSNPLVACWR
jgi:hypothetical protein